mmetsp:Transcript_8589/g.9690  ORF Transcript_8589/g.9690 Transcript_8589/m.9690 type:complete len:105 (-) Transcript_8589:205-519(-)
MTCFKRSNVMCRLNRYNTGFVGCADGFFAPPFKKLSPRMLSSPKMLLLRWDPNLLLLRLCVPDGNSIARLFRRWELKWLSPPGEGALLSLADVATTCPSSCICA